MRWKDNSPTTGDIRYCSGYLFFPLTINRETRWLESARWKEGYSCGIWFPKEWVDE